MPKHSTKPRNGSSIRSRIVKLLKVPASQIEANPLNWRAHPDVQVRALQESVKRVGFVDPPLVYQTKSGKYRLVDGHLRVGTFQGETLDVLLTDLNEDEANEVMASKDALTSLAIADEDKSLELLGQLKKDAVDFLIDMLPDTWGVLSMPDVEIPSPEPESSVPHKPSDGKSLTLVLTPRQHTSLQRALREFDDSPLKFLMAALAAYHRKEWR